MEIWKSLREITEYWRIGASGVKKYQGLYSNSSLYWCQIYIHKNSSMEYDKEKYVKDFWYQGCFQGSQMSLERLVKADCGWTMDE